MTFVLHSLQSLFCVQSFTIIYNVGLLVQSPGNGSRDRQTRGLCTAGPVLVRATSAQYRWRAGSLDDNCSGLFRELLPLKFILHCGIL